MGINTMKILIIGASRGIGLEFVRQYTAAGAQVIATARSDTGLQTIQGLGAKPLKLDVADPASVSGLAWQLDGEKLDVALYVAGVYTKTDAATPPTMEEFDRTMHANVLGAMRAIPQVAPLVEAANHGQGGKFIFITSAMGSIGAVESSFGWTYRVSKAALNMAVMAAQHDYPRALMLPMHPGWVRTDMGGPGAPLGVEQSVASMRTTIAGLTAKNKGQFLDHDGRVFSSW
jgi:NAD(P)-dependent dehydrogenase (short-subunit alcohol dehydrogenase family)